MANSQVDVTTKNVVRWRIFVKPGDVTEDSISAAGDGLTFDTGGEPVPVVAKILLRTNCCRRQPLTLNQFFK